MNINSISHLIDFTNSSESPINGSDSGGTNPEAYKIIINEVSFKSLFKKQYLSMQKVSLYRKSRYSRQQAGVTFYS